MAMQPVLYVILLGLLLIVYARLIPATQGNVANAKTTVVKEIEDTIEHFAAEMDEQNQVMLDLFSKTKQDYEVELAKLAGRLETLERQKHELSRELSTLSVNQQQSHIPKHESTIAAVVHDSQVPSQPIQQISPVAPVEAEILPVDPVYQGLSMKSRYAELFGLHDQGKSVEAIAKKLNMNKGEVSLILQLARQEERTRV